ncbi:MAG TPA: thioesterase family protein [Pyrinomonadaceae bacterium]|nr:thioesterase family protein [Pyrinomonadaceae bacterium]
MTFSARIKVRFGDADPAGLVYYPVLFHYCHAAMEDFFAARCGVPYNELVSRRRLGFPTVNVRAEFFAPLVYGDEVLVEVWVSRVGGSSATFEYRLRRASDGRLCASASLVQVAMSLDVRAAVPIPEDLRRAFEQSAESAPDAASAE